MKSKKSVTTAIQASSYAFLAFHSSFLVISSKPMQASPPKFTIIAIGTLLCIRWMERQLRRTPTQMSWDPIIAGIIIQRKKRK